MKVRKKGPFVSLSALVLLALFTTACAPHSAENGGSSGAAESSNGSEIETRQLVQFTSELGCTVTYDTSCFVVFEPEDKSVKKEELALSSIEKINDFSVCFRVDILDASTVEEAVDHLSRAMNLDCIRRVDFLDEVIQEEVTFGAEHYAAIRLTFNEVYAVGEIYVTEQNGSVYMAEISSYYQPSEELLAQAYDILDSLTF